MADDINISVGYQDVINADKAAIKLAKAFTDMEKAAGRGATGLDGLLALTSKLESANLSLSQVYKSIDDDQKRAYNTAAKLETAYLKRNESTRTLTQAKQDMVAALKAQDQAEAAEQKRMQYLANQYVYLHKETMQYKNTVRDLLQAKRGGLITFDEYSKKVQKLKEDFRDVQSGTATWSNQFVQGGTAASKSMNSTSVAVQQLGYQVGDFFVQVQSGTNALVAFGQQATQLVGVLPNVATQLGLTMTSAVALSASLGIAIPIVTAIGAAWWRYSAAQDDAAEKTKTLEDELKSLDQRLADWVRTKKAAAAGLTVSELLGEEGIEAATKSVVEAQEELEEVVNRNRSALSYLFGSGFVAARQEVNATKELTAARENLFNAYKRLGDEQRRLAESQMSSYLDERLSLLQNIELNKKILQFGKDSAQVKALEAKQSIKNYNDQIDKQVKSKDITETQGQVLKNLNAELVQSSANLDTATSRTSAWQAAMVGVRYEINAIMSSLGNIGGTAIDTAAKQAEINALKAGKSIKEAAIAQQTFRKELEWTAREQSGGLIEKGLVWMERGQYQYNLELDKTLDKERSLAREREAAAAKVSSGGGSKGPSALTLDKRETSLQSLMSQYMPTQDEFEQAEEKLMVWREKAQDALLNAQLKERGMLEEHNAYKLEIEQRYQDQMDAIQRNRQDYKLQSYESFFGTMANVFQSGGEKTLKISKAFGIAEATISMWRGAAKALELPYPANLAAWANVMATGAQAIAGIKSVTSGGGSSSSSASSASSASSSSVTQSTANTNAPLQISFVGIEDESYYKGGKIKELFNDFYKENKARGGVFKVV